MVRHDSAHKTKREQTCVFAGCVATGSLQEAGCIRAATFAVMFESPMDSMGMARTRRHRVTNR